jgi:hypothetical protein
MKTILSIFILFFIQLMGISGYAQQSPGIRLPKPSQINKGKIVSHEIATTKKGVTTYATIIDKDTLPLFYMKEVWIVDNKSFKNGFQRWKYERLVRNVKKAYPYAKVAGDKVKEYNKLIVSTKSEIEKKKLLKMCEKQLISQFEKDIKNLTVSQGKILLKLIDRETGKTSYEILKEFRGGTQATMWQTLARIFGNDLKSEYDPQKDDKTIEDIVCLIDKGFL